MICLGMNMNSTCWHLMERFPVASLFCPITPRTQLSIHYGIKVPSDNCDGLDNPWNMFYPVASHQLVFRDSRATFIWRLLLRGNSSFKVSRKFRFIYLYQLHAFLAPSNCLKKHELTSHAYTIQDTLGNKQMWNPLYYIENSVHTRGRAGEQMFYCEVNNNQATSYTETIPRIFTAT